MAVVEVNWKPGARTLRSFGWICLVALGAIGAWVYFRQSLLGFALSASAAHGTGYCLWAAAALCAVVAAVAPRALWPLYVTLTAVTLPIGLVVSHVVLALLFYGVFTPMALIFRVIGRDSLRRKFDPGAGTYWVQRRATTDVERYFRQS